MKKIIFVFTILFFGSLIHTSAQVFSPQLAGFYGIGTIYYPNGYYQGNVSNGVANGSGTFYYRDGSFFRGSFSNGWWHGKGVIVSPYYGYVAGCWSNGVYTGQCQSYNRYEEYDEVEDVINEVQYEKPDDSRYTSISPEGYKVKRIDADTQMGRKLLGRYSGN